MGSSVDLGSNLESRAFLFWVVLGSEGLGSKGGYFLCLLAWSEGGGDGPFHLMGSLDLDWLGLV